MQAHRMPLLRLPKSYTAFKAASACKASPSRTGQPSLKGAKHVRSVQGSLARLLRPVGGAEAARYQDATRAVARRANPREQLCCSPSGPSRAPICATGAHEFLLAVAATPESRSQHAASSSEVTLTACLCVSRTRSSVSKLSLCTLLARRRGRAINFARTVSACIPGVRGKHAGWRSQQPAESKAGDT